MKIIKKVICIGSNCIAADIMHSVGLREPSPVDNISCFNIWKSHSLFDGEFKKLLFRFPYEERKSTEQEKKQFFYGNKVFKFCRGFYIVHNDFESKKFKKSIKKRIKNFIKYYKKSLKDESLWYVYSLNIDDENLTEVFFEQLLPSLPKICRDRLICIGMRGHNSLFEKYFTYYLDCGREEDYKWHDKSESLYFIRQLEKKYNLQFVFSEGIE